MCNNAENPNAEQPKNEAVSNLPPNSVKSKGEIYVELAKLSQQSIDSRRTYEWKLAFGLWTGIGVFTYFAGTCSRVFSVLGTFPS